tara:strand:- start:1068 stop:1664 length:597 start_codon:yes stop_codon:yes gene_type:complete
MCAPFLAPLGTAIVGSSTAATMTAAQLATIGTSAAFGIAQTGLSIVSQQRMAKAQAKAQANASAAEADRVRAQMIAMRIEEAQRNQAIAQKIDKTNLEAQRKQGTVVVAAGEAGVSGVSVNNLERAVDFSRGTALYTLGKQQEFFGVGQQFAFENAAMASQMKQIQINQPIESPDIAGSLMSGVRTGLSIYDATKPTV